MKALWLARRAAHVLSGLVFPRVCGVCGRSLAEGTGPMCLHCLDELPRTGLHRSDFNDLHKRLARPGLPIVHAYAWYHYYRGTAYTRLIHDAKYHSLPSTAVELGRLMAAELLADPSVRAFEGVEALVPVPLDPWKALRRGYNQAERIAQGISRATGVPVVADGLMSVRSRRSQTTRTASMRRVNASGAFALNPRRLSRLQGRHIMLVDDVVTTGSTALAALTALQPAASSLSIAALAVTHSLH